MDLTNIRKNVEKHIRLEEKEIEVFHSVINPRSVRRKQILSQSGQVCASIFFVNQGALRAFHTDQDGNENIIMFAVNDWWITDMFSFTSRKPSVMTIDALEDSDLLELQRDNLEMLYREVPKFERFFRIIFQNAYIRKQLRIIENLSLPAEDRYNNFLRKYPQFVERVSLKQMASYLGMTPEFLSVVRSKNKRSQKS